MEGMTFRRVWREVQGREAKSGNYLSDREAKLQAAEEILEGFRYQGTIDFDGAREAVEDFEGRVAGCTATGCMFGSETLAAAIRWADVQMPTTHEQRVNCADRQVCCDRCHACGRESREVLDGESWCVYCEVYR